MLAFALSTFAGGAAAAENPCDNTSDQSSNLRIEKERNGVAIQVLDKSAHWRVVFRSPGEVAFPRQSPDTAFLAYVTIERGGPWLYVLRLSTGAKEPVSALDSKPADICFDSTESVIHSVGPSGAVTDYDIAAQLRLLPGR